MRIVVLGAGAMGGLYGSYLSRGNDVTMVDINADVEANASVSMIETMSLSKRGAAMKKALEVYEKGQQTKAK